MARVFATKTHRYERVTDRGVEVFTFNADTWREVPDDVAAAVCSAHPQKLVRLKPGEDRPAEPEPELVVETVAEPAKTKIVLFRSVRGKR